MVQIYSLYLPLYNYIIIILCRKILTYFIIHSICNLIKRILVIILRDELPTQLINHSCVTTIDVERFAGLNICSFSLIKVFVEIFSHCLGQNYSLFSIIKEKCLYSWKNFHCTLENCEKEEILGKQIFSRLWYILNLCLCQAKEHNDLINNSLY